MNLLYVGDRQRTFLLDKGKESIERVFLILKQSDHVIAGLARGTVLNKRRLKSLLISVLVNPRPNPYRFSITPVSVAHSLARRLVNVVSCSVPSKAANCSCPR